MALLSGAAGLLNQSVTIAPYQSRNDYAETTWGVGAANDCRIVYQQERVFDPMGEEALSHAQIYLNGSATVTTQSKITLPDATVVTRILKIETRYAADGTALYKVVYI